VQGTFARRFSLVAAFFVIVSLWFIATPVHAAPRTQVSKHHDLSHPVNLATLSRGAVYTVHPDTQSFPSGCYNNVAYAQTENGAVYWQKVDSTGTVKVWVQYYWCPKYSGDTVGQNFSYGRDYAITGCTTFIVGLLTGPGWSVELGAMMQLKGTISPNIFDGYSNSINVQACNGAYVDDYSLAKSGTGQYKAWMHLQDTYPGVDLEYSSPLFQ